MNELKRKSKINGEKNENDKENNVCNNGDKEDKEYNSNNKKNCYHNRNNKSRREILKLIMNQEFEAKVNELEREMIFLCITGIRNFMQENVVETVREILKNTKSRPNIIILRL